MNFVHDLATLSLAPHSASSRCGLSRARFKQEVCVEKQAKKIGSAVLVDRLVAEVVPSQLYLCGGIVATLWMVQYRTAQ